MFYRAKVKLFVDFASVDNVTVIGSSTKEEQEQLEKSIDREK